MTNKSKREQHVGRSRQELQEYHKRYIASDHQPTSSEPYIDSSDSDKGGIELTAPPSIEKSRGSLIDQVNKHFKENWLGWVAAFYGALLLFLYISTNGNERNVAIHGVELSNQKERISSIETTAQKQNEISHSQDIILKEHDIKIENLEKRIVDTPSNNQTRIK